jgi:hypothetical protein
MVHDRAGIASMNRTIIAITAALATLSSAHAAVQTVEADNGAVYEILYTTHDPMTGEAHAHVLTPDNEEIHIVFDCHGRMIIPSVYSVRAPIRAIPPRSVAGRVAAIACGRAQ